MSASSTLRALETLGLVVLLLGLGQLTLQALLLGAVWLRALVTGEAWNDAIRVVTTEPLALGLAQLLGLGAVIALGTRLLRGDRPPLVALGVLPGTVVSTQVLGLSFVAGLALQLPLVELMNLLQDLAPTLARDPLRDEPLAFVYATLAGLVLGGLTARAPSILPAIALHAGFNAMPVLLPPEVAAIDGFNTAADAHLPWWLVLGSGGIAAVALALAVRALPPPR